MSASVTKSSGSEPSERVLLASTQQLNDVIRKINPFEANFRQANKITLTALVDAAAGDCGQNSPVAGAAVDSSASPVSSISRSTTSASGDMSGGCSAQQHELLLNLPAPYNKLSLTLPVASHFGSNIETPDLSSLICQAIKCGSPLIQTPQTAEILRTALDMREMVENRTDGLGLKMSIMSKLNSALQPFLEHQLSLTLADLPSMSLQQARNLTRNNSNSPTTSQQKSYSTVDPISVEPLAKVRKQEEQDSDPILPYRLIPANRLLVGQESSAPAYFYLPLKLSNARNSVDEETPTKSSIKRSVSTSEDDYTNQLIKAEWNAEAESSGNLHRSSHLFYDHVDPCRSCESSTDQFLGEGDRRKESLERNKEAAWRYRKRKKEEKCVLEGRAQFLERDNISLLTQVAALKNQLKHVTDILKKHKNCPSLGQAGFQDFVDCAVSSACSNTAAKRVQLQSAAATIHEHHRMLLSTSASTSNSMSVSGSGSCASLFSQSALDRLMAAPSTSGLVAQSRDSSAFRRLILPPAAQSALAAASTTSSSDANETARAAEGFLGRR